jgi:hypothetical protein
MPDHMRRERESVVLPTRRKRRSTRQGCSTCKANTRIAVSPFIRREPALYEDEPNVTAQPTVCIFTDKQPSHDYLMQPPMGKDDVAMSVVRAEWRIRVPKNPPHNSVFGYLLLFVIYIRYSLIERCLRLGKCEHPIWCDAIIRSMDYEPENR